MKPAAPSRRTVPGAERLNNVRVLRTGRVGVRTLASELGVQIDDIARRHRALGVVGERWGSLVPGGLAGRVWPESWRRGTLTVRAADSASGFEFDRWLRAGGEAVLREAGARKVRVAVG